MINGKNLLKCTAKSCQNNISIPLYFMGRTKNVNKFQYATQKRSILTSPILSSLSTLSSTRSTIFGNKNYCISFQSSNISTDKLKRLKRFHEMERNADKKTSSSSPKSWFKFLVFLIPGAITLYLGIWQSKRYLWKVDLIEQRKKQLEQKAIQLDLAHTEEMLYRLIELKGQYDYSKEVLVGLRQSPAAKRQYVQSGRNSSIEMGFYLLTPFIVSNEEEDGGSSTDKKVILWVNRGWIPKDMADRRSTMIPGEISLQAIARESERPVSSIFSLYRDQSFVKDNWWLVSRPQLFSHKYFPDQDNITVVTDIVFDAVAENSVHKSPFSQYPMAKHMEDHIEFYVMPETHLSYAITWFGMCAWIVSTAAYMKLKRKL